MASIKQVIKELENALKTNNFDEFIRLVKEDTSVLNKPFQKDNIKLLHKLCSINIGQLNQDEKDNEDEMYKVTEQSYLTMLEQLLDDIDFNFNVTDAHGDTPLHYAVYTKNKSMVELLLKYEDTNIEQTNKNGNTPLAIAVENKLVEIEKLLLNEANNQIEEVDIPENMSIKEYQRHKKKSIIDLGAMGDVTNEKQEAYQKVESTLYFENKKQGEEFKGVLKKASNDAVLGPMIAMLGLCAARGTIAENRRLTLFNTMSSLNQMHSESEISKSEYEEAVEKIQKELGKKFKVICVDADDVTMLRPLVTEARGLYTNNNTIFIATNGLAANDIFATMMHESSHFIINQLFKNTSNPFPPGERNNNLKMAFEKIVKKTKYDLEAMKENINIKQDIAYNIIHNVFLKYDKQEWAAELIVRVPQIIAQFGPRKGYQWLEKHTPELLRFYQQEITPKINEYLNEHQASLYISGLQQPKTEYNPKNN